MAFVKENHQAVSLAGPAPLFGLIPPFRTLWHALYEPERRAVQVSFYLRDEPDPDRSGKVRIVRSNYLEFVLKGEDAMVSRRGLTGGCSGPAPRAAEPSR
jgi:hypothetical protein